MAGQCEVLTMQQRYRDSAAVYDQLWPILSNLKERPMREMLEDFVVPTNRRYLEGDEHAERSEQK